MEIIPYLTFDGTCREAFEAYARILGGEIEAMQTHGDSPMAAQTPPDQHDRILHVRLRVGDRQIMGSDAPPQFFSQPQGFSVLLGLTDLDEAKRIHAALAEGGREMMTFQPTFWARGFGMVIDRWGTPWMIDC